MESDKLRRTALFDLHVERGGRMVPFAGYEMPVRYGAGPVAEHSHTRTAVSLFDVSHMGIVDLVGPGADLALEALVPAAVATLAVQRLRYTMFTNDRGGVIDDLMVARRGSDSVTVVVNAGNYDLDLAHLRAGLPASIAVLPRRDLSLLALQGPLAEVVLSRLAPAVAALSFLDVADVVFEGLTVAVSRSGYTGEDGFELAVPTGSVVAVAERLLAEPEVALAGLAARDSLRLEAGLCLHGHDLDETITPIEAGLAWTIQARRRQAGGFPGAEIILAQLANGAPRQRVGLQPLGRKPVRDGSTLHDGDGAPIGSVTSGGFSPCLGTPLAMGYLRAGHHAVGTEVSADVRGVAVACQVIDLPAVAHRYHRAG